MAGQPVPKPRARIRDRQLLALLHIQGGTCALADATCERTLNLHHVYPRSQGGDDVRENLIWLCGSGTTGHHGAVHHDREARAALYGLLPSKKPEMLRYLSEKLGSQEAAHQWLARYS